MLSRRKLIKRLSSLPVIGGILGGSIIAPQALAKTQVRRNYYKELGVRTVINAAGTYTSLTGSIMPEEAVDAWSYASNEYVPLVELQDAVGKKIAGLIGCEAAMVTAGAASALTLGTAGVLTGTDGDKAHRIPTDLSGMKNEVILQKGHNIGYAHAVRNCGVKIVEVDSRKALLNAINENTAMLFFINKFNPDSPVKLEELIQIGRENGIPVFNDAAADTPPKERLWEYTDMGCDLVTFSGGKALRGPQSTGLLLGRKDLIEAARFNHLPYGDRIGRGMKVNKEEYIAMWIALEKFLQTDWDKEWKRWEKQINYIADAASAVNGVKTEIHVPDIANHVPTLDITWDESIINASGNDMRQALKDGHPSIETKGGKNSLSITTFMMLPKQEYHVAERIGQELKKAGGKT